MDETEDLKLWTNLVHQVAAHLAARPVQVRYRWPTVAPFAGAAYKQNGAAIIDVTPDATATAQLKIYLHELSHIRADWGNFEDNNQAAQAPASIIFTRQEAVENQVIIAPLEGRADQQAAAWLKFTEDHYRDYPSWSELKSRLISLLYWK